MVGAGWFSFEKIVCSIFLFQAQSGVGHSFTKCVETAFIRRGVQNSLVAKMNTFFVICDLMRKPDVTIFSHV